MRTAAMNKVAVGVLLGFVTLGVAVLALPRGDYRVTGAAASAVVPSLAAASAPSASAAESAAQAGSAQPGNVDRPAGDGVDGVPGAPAGQRANDGTADAATAATEGSASPSDLSGAPKSLRFGVVLVRYAGAQGAPAGSRSKAAAATLAGELAEAAKGDFAAAVKRGDSGSTEDAGKMFRGILEPHIEHAVFSLEKAQVSEAVDTPRGFWIVRRIQ
ncbi:MAG: hypothetical protein EXR75_13585 [Myxococcales bacterium]|nr:hypothetical protein [Myxococcales bacterium]